jgi:hypothetical protein
MATNGCAGAVVGWTDLRNATNDVYAARIGSDCTITAVAENSPQSGGGLLSCNYPNPFNPSTVIRYEIANPGHVSLRVYDAGGVLVKVLQDQHRKAGRYEVNWNGEDEKGHPVSSGVYFCRLSALGITQTTKMVLVK